MTHWGYFLLAAFVIIGLRHSNERRAIHWVVGLTAVAIVYAMHTYGGLH
jgi:hypothetical protein